MNTIAAACRAVVHYDVERGSFEDLVADLVDNDAWLARDHARILYSA